MLNPKNRIGLKFLLSVGIALATTPSLATAEPSLQTLRPGMPSVDGSVIQPYNNKWKLVGRGADGSVIEMGTWQDIAKVEKRNGRDVVIRQQIWIHDRGAEGYLNIFDRKTMVPILSQYTNAGGLYRRFQFSADGKTVDYQSSPMPPEEGTPPGAQPFRISNPMLSGTIKLGEPLFDFNTGMFGLLLVGMPLEPGYSARFPVFRSFDPKVEPAWVDFEVTGKESVPAGPGKTVEAWLIVAHSPATDEVMTFDLIKEPPYIIRLRQAWQGRDWTFEML